MAKVTEVVKEIAQCWQKLTKDDRSKYKEAAKRGKSLGLITVRQGEVRAGAAVARVVLGDAEETQEVPVGIYDLRQGGITIQCYIL